MHENGPVAIIGSGRELEARIRHHVLELIDFGKGAPNFELNRLTVAQSAVSWMFQESGSRTVGGPFQIVRIVPPPANSQEIFMWLPETAQFEVMHQGNLTVLRNLETEIVCTLFPVWEWP